MTPQELKNSILQLAIQGKLVEQRPEEGTAEELYREIQAEKQRMIKVGKIKKEKSLPEIAGEEKPFDIPESWMWVRLRSFGTFSSGKTPTMGVGENWNNGTVSWITSKDMKQKYLNSSEMLITEKAAREMKMYPSNTMLMVVRSGILKRLLPVAILTGESTINQDIKALSLYIPSIAEYVYVILKGMENHILKEYRKQVTTVDSLRFEDFQNMPVPLPPLAEQKRIVAKIEELLPYIDRYEQAWSRLEDFNKRFPDNMKKSILQLAIQGKLVEQRPEEGTAEELYQQIQAEKRRLIKAGKIKKEKPLPEIAEEEKPFDIPESWKWVPVGDVCTNIQYGSSQKSSPIGKIAVLRMGNIQSGRLVLDKLVYTSDDEEIAKYPLQYNDILFNRTNSKELVGKAAIYKNEIPAIYAGYLVRITPLLINSDYLNYVMQSQFYWSYCQSVRSDAIGQSNINAEKLKRFVFPLPPIAEQKRIVEKLEELLPLCEGLK